MLKLNTTRTFTSAVTVHFVTEAGREESGKMKAEFKIIPTDQFQNGENDDKTLLDLVLVSVSNIELTDDKGDLLEGEALIEACKTDPSISTALVSTFTDKIVKKNRK